MNTPESRGWLTFTPPGLDRTTKDRVRAKAARLRALGLTWREVGERIGRHDSGAINDARLHHAATRDREKYCGASLFPPMNLVEGVKAQAAVDRLVDLIDAGARLPR